MEQLIIILCGAISILGIWNNYNLNNKIHAHELR